MLIVCLFVLCAVLLSVAAAHPALAALPDTIWYSKLLPPGSPGKLRIEHFNDVLQMLIIAISALVAIALIYTIVKFSRKRNPTPSGTTHNVKLEIIWTLIPTLIVIALFFCYSMPLMYYLDKSKHPEVTLKVTGYQWYWGYSYPDLEIEEYTNYFIPTHDQDKKNEFDALRNLPTYQRLLSTYDLTTGQPSFVVLPAGVDVRILVTGADVIHSWSLPAMGVKKDAVPGRVNETWVHISKPGIYYGQCSQICGTNHGFMPIEVRAVPMDVFKQWAEMMKTDSAKAMAMVQEQSTQYAQKTIVAPQLTLQALWDDVKTQFAH